jgi:hypothetical protein
MVGRKQKFWCCSRTVFLRGQYFQAVACGALKEYARAEGVSNMPEQREYRPEIRSRFGVGVRSFS